MEKNPQKKLNSHLDLIPANSFAFASTIESQALDVLSHVSCPRQLTLESKSTVADASTLDFEGSSMSHAHMSWSVGCPVPLISKTGGSLG